MCFNYFSFYFLQVLFNYLFPFKLQSLPLGLSIENGLFVLQRARHAKKWCRPGCEINGHPVFYGLKIALALDKVDFEKKWLVSFNYFL